MNKDESQCSPLNENLLQTGVDEIGHNGGIITAHCLYALAVHLIMSFSTREVQTCIPLLINQQVGEVYLKNTEGRTLQSCTQHTHDRWLGDQEATVVNNTHTVQESLVQHTFI